MKFRWQSYTLQHTHNKPTCGDVAVSLTHTLLYIQQAHMWNLSGNYVSKQFLFFWIHMWQKSQSQSSALAHIVVILAHIVVMKLFTEKEFKVLFHSRYKGLYHSSQQCLQWWVLNDCQVVFLDVLKQDLSSSVNGLKPLFQFCRPTLIFPEFLIDIQRL